MKAALSQKALFVSPTLIYLLAFTIYPLIYALGISFTDLNLARQGTGVFVGIRNYVGLFSSETLFPRAVANVFITISIGITVELVLGYAIARLFFVARNLKAIVLIRTIYIVPIMITPLVFGLVSSYVFNPLLGIANFVLSLARIPPLPWYGSPHTALATIILVDTWQWTPFMVLVLLSGLMSIPPDLLENAEVDGARLPQKIFLIEVPLITRVIGIAVLMRFMDIFRMFDLVYATTQGGPGGATEIISMFAYREAFNYYNTGIGSAAAILALIMTTVLSLFLNRYLGGHQR